MIRGEIAYERSKGLDGGLIDAPAIRAVSDSTADATRQLEIFEPRISIDSIDVTDILQEIGDVNIDVTMRRKAGETI
jgi:phage baseplate assembly protein W